ncbi:MAG: hypothetical protein C0402_10750 [Thermodesulfovibrio sp.]|nr:hypothetical protein [Thermodesulfovibrio sp.]
MFAAGLISVRYPSVSGIAIQMTYYQKTVNHVLMVRTVNIFPTSFAYFNMDCLVKGCDGGGFDLTAVVASMVKARKKVQKGKLDCAGKVDAVDADHASVDYEIVIEYS